METWQFMNLSRTFYG